MKTNEKIHRKQYKNKNKTLKNINLLYVNPDGIMGKIPSLNSVAKTTDAHIIALAETKLGKISPNTPGYHWINGYRKSGKGGGVALLVRDDIKHLTKEETDLEDQDQEIKWLKLMSGRKTTFIGIYYGPQEKVSNEEADRQYSQITSQIIKLKKKGEIILMGDFNAKLEINNNIVSQKQSRNGEYMQRMLDETNMIPKSLEADIGHWTRVKRKDTKERSVIDYVLISEGIVNSIKHIEIDEIGACRLKGKEETDHNTIMIELNLDYKTKIITETIYNTKNKSNWKSFNDELTKSYELNEPQSYSEFEELIKTTMDKTLKKITIKRGQYKPKISEKAKQLKSEKRLTRKEFKNAPPHQKLAKLDAYVQKQKELREELEQMEKLMVEAKVNKLIQEGGIKSDRFWKIRKQILNKSRQQDDYDTITEEGKTLTEPEETKEYVASFYENLYQAREGTKEYEQWTEHISKTVKEIEKNIETMPEEPEFTTMEILKVLRSLKKGKAPGPDGIPNEALKAFNPQIIELYRCEMNKILTSMEIPPQWTDGNLKRLYKGKGVKGKCSNERGITLASNVGKMYERLINNRISPEVNMSDAQAGGIKGRATVDHILILKELVHIAKCERKKTILTFLDVTKAYDKAWLDAILYVLHKQGIQNRLWKIVKDLNSNLKTTIQTKYGPTRQIHIKDSIRQGGVLSVTLYALMMDEIAKDLKETVLGIKIPGSDQKIPCLLWMDDVVLAETKTDKSQDLLNNTNHTSKKYHIEFGMPKTKYLRTGKSNDEIELKLGDSTIDETDKYTYLGEVNNKNMNLKDQIKSIASKVEAAYQTLIAIAEDQNFKNIKMECVWKLVDTCIIPIITYASETWEPNKGEMKKLNQILDKILKRILMTPAATPREALYIETGLLDVETVMDAKRLNMMARLNRSKSELMATVLANPECKWIKKTREIMNKYGIEPEDLTGPKEKTKFEINQSVSLEFRRKMTKDREERSKLNYFLEGKVIWKPEEPAEYMTKLTRKQASTIFKARTRMIKVKGNYKNGFPDLTCRACNIEPETQVHVLNECKKLHPDNSTSTKNSDQLDKNDLFNENPDALRANALKICEIYENLTKDCDK